MKIMLQIKLLVFLMIVSFSFNQETWIAGSVISYENSDCSGESQEYPDELYSCMFQFTLNEDGSGTQSNCDGIEVSVDSYLTWIIDGNGILHITDSVCEGDDGCEGYMIEEECPDNCNWDVEIIMFNPTNDGNYSTNYVEEAVCDDEMYDNQQDCEDNDLDWHDESCTYIEITEGMLDCVNCSFDDESCETDEDCDEGEVCDLGECVMDGDDGEMPECFEDCNFLENDFNGTPNELCNWVVTFDSECWSDCDQNDYQVSMIIMVYSMILEQYTSVCEECLSDDSLDCSDAFNSETYCDGSDESNGEGWYCCGCDCEDFSDAECLESEYDNGECDLDCGNNDGPPGCIEDCENFDSILNFNFEAEEYVDSNDNGMYDVGESFSDDNGNGIWDDGDSEEEFCTIIVSWESSDCWSDCEGEDLDDVTDAVADCTECLELGDCTGIFEDECETDDDCDDGEWCDESECVTNDDSNGEGNFGDPCGNDSDCSEGLVCNWYNGAYACIECEFDSECEFGEYCEDSECISEDSNDECQSEGEEYCESDNFMDQESCDNDVLCSWDEGSCWYDATDPNWCDICESDDDCEDGEWCDNGYCDTDEGDDGPPECLLDCEGIEDVNPDEDADTFCSWLINVDASDCMMDCDNETMDEIINLMISCETCLEYDDYNCEDAISDECESDDDCDDGSWCENGECYECDYDDDCDDGYWCENGDCVSDDDGAPMCIEDCPNFDLVDGDTELSSDESCVIISSWGSNDCIDDCQGDDLEMINMFVWMCTECLENGDCEDVFGDDSECDFDEDCEDGQICDEGECIGTNECSDCMGFCTTYVMDNYGYSYDDAYEWCLNTSDASNGCADSCTEMGSNVTSPLVYKLSAPFPNPFNPVTTISYEISKYDFVNISVFDINGQLVENLVNGMVSSGQYSIVWNASQYPSGIYFIKMISDAYNSTEKVLLIK